MAFLKMGPHPSDPPGVLFESGDLETPYSFQESWTHPWQLWHWAWEAPQPAAGTGETQAHNHEGPSLCYGACRP